MCFNSTATLSAGFLASNISAGYITLRCSKKVKYSSTLSMCLWPWQFNKKKLFHMNPAEWLVLSFVRLNITFEWRKKYQQNLESAKSKLIQCCFCVPGVNPPTRDARNILVTQHKAGPLSVRRLSDCCQTGSLLAGQHCLPWSQHTHTHTLNYTKNSHKQQCFEKTSCLSTSVCSCESHTLSDT